jgi:hypothetical protein
VSVAVQALVTDRIVLPQHLQAFAEVPRVRDRLRPRLSHLYDCGRRFESWGRVREFYLALYY